MRVKILPLCFLLSSFLCAASAPLSDAFRFFRVPDRREDVPGKIPDSAESVHVGFKWQGKRDWAWFVADCVIPEKVEGVTVAGKPLGIRISCGEGGAVFVDSELRTRYDNDKPALVLVSEKARPGRRVRLAVHAHGHLNREGEVRFSEGRWEILSAERALKPVVLTVDPSRVGKPVPEGIVGLSQGGCMADYEDATAEALRRAGFKWFRMDNVLTSCVKEADGKSVYDFTDLDRRVDFIYKIGAKPIIAASYMPQPLDAVPDPERHSAPKDYRKWEELCRRAAKHCLERGKRIPYWEVWNEPNTGWIKPGPNDTGSKEFEEIYRLALEGAKPDRNVLRMLEAYLKLYAATARGVLRADPAARIGGPALASGPFEHSERGHCFNGKLFARGLMIWCERKKLPLDFLSWHEYFQPPEVFRAEAEAFRRYLERFPHLKKSVRSLMITEWNEAWWADPPQDNEIGAAWCASVIIRAFLPAGIDKPCFFYAKQGDRTFRGDYGLLMGGNVPKPQYNVMRIFNGLRGRWLEVEGGNGEICAVGALEGAAGRIRVIIVNHTDRYNLKRRVRVVVKGVGNARWREYRIDCTNCNVYHDPAKAELSVCRKGRFTSPQETYEAVLPPHSVVLLEIERE